MIIVIIILMKVNVPLDLEINLQIIIVQPQHIVENIIARELKKNVQVLQKLMNAIVLLLLIDNAFMSKVMATIIDAKILKSIVNVK